MAQLKGIQLCPGWSGSDGWSALAGMAKGWGFDSWSGHTPNLCCKFNPGLGCLWEADD